MKDAVWDSLLKGLAEGPLQPEKRDGRPIVFFRTPWERLDDGWSVAARAYAKTMEAAGIDVRLFNWKVGDKYTHPDTQKEVGHLARIPTEWDLDLFSCTLAGGAHMKELINNLLEGPGKHAYHCVFERRYVEPQLVESLNQLDGVWAQCLMNYEVLVEAGVKNVEWIPFPYFDDDPHLKLPPPRQCRSFYWIGRMEPRKAPENLLRAFMRAFKPDEATLTIKASRFKTLPYATLEEIIEDQIHFNDVVRVNGWRLDNWRESIRLFNRFLSTEEMFQIHAEGDVYVSPSRGEGLELGAYAAKLAGRTLVMTDSGGPRDFMTESDLMVYPTRLVPACGAYPWGEGANYIDYNVDDLAAALQNVRYKIPRGDRIHPKFHYSNVGLRFRNWIERLIS